MPRYSDVVKDLRSENKDKDLYIGPRRGQSRILEDKDNNTGLQQSMAYLLISASKPFFTETSCALAVTEWTMHNGLFAEWEVLDNFRVLYDPRTRTRIDLHCKLVLDDPRGPRLRT